LKVYRWVRGIYSLYAGLAGVIQNDVAAFGAGAGSVAGRKRKGVRREKVSGTFFTFLSGRPVCGPSDAPTQRFCTAYHFRSLKRFLTPLPYFTVLPCARRSKESMRQMKGIHISDSQSTVPNHAILGNQAPAAN